MNYVNVVRESRICKGVLLLVSQEDENGEADGESGRWKWKTLLETLENKNKK